MVKLKYAVIAAILWTASGVINFAASNASDRADYPLLVINHKWTRENCGVAAFMGLAGPVAFFPVLFKSGFYYSEFSFDCGEAEHE